MNDLARLDARSFHAHLADLLRAEFGAQGAFLLGLAEFDRRNAFRDLGYASLFDYLHRGLKLSRGAAHHRRAAAWLVERFPEVLEPIQDGRLCFTTAIDPGDGDDRGEPGARCCRGSSDSRSGRPWRWRRN